MANLWSEYVSKEIWDSVDDDERKRQEILFEIIKTEQEYVKDLQTLYDKYCKPLEESNQTIILPVERQKVFVTSVFGNLNELIIANEYLCKQLSQLIQDNPIVPGVGQVFIQWLNLKNPHQPYIDYGKNQPIGKFYADEELISNPSFKSFCQTNERLPECRKLPLQSFLSRPTTRLGRYPLLLQTLLKKTKGNQPESDFLTQSIDNIKSILAKVNEAAGISQAKVRIKFLQLHIQCKTPEQQRQFEDVANLGDDKRVLIREGTMMKRGDADEISLLLFDNCLLLTEKSTTPTGNILLHLKKWAIPLCMISAEEVVYREDLELAMAESVPSPLQSPKSSQYDLLLKCGGRFSFAINLSAPSASIKQWIEEIMNAKNSVFSRMQLYQLKSILKANDDDESFSDMTVNNEIYCYESFESHTLLGTHDGLFCGSVKISPCKRVTQLMYCKEFKCLLLISDYELLSIAPDELEEAISLKRLVKHRRITGHVSFFDVGENYNEKFLFAVKSKLISTYIKIFSFIGRNNLDGRKSSLSQMIRRISINNSDSNFKIFREIYIPTDVRSIRILKNKISVGSVLGFELIDIKTCETQELIDSSDSSFMDTFKARETITPLAMFRIGDDELFLCFQEFGMYVDNRGRNSRPSQKVPHVIWMSIPESFALDNGINIIATSSNFVEVRNISTGMLNQIIKIDNGKLASGKPNSVYIACYQTTNSNTTTGLMSPMSMYSRKSGVMRKPSYATEITSPKSEFNLYSGTADLKWLKLVHESVTVAKDPNHAIDDNISFNDRPRKSVTIVPLARSASSDSEKSC